MTTTGGGTRDPILTIRDLEVTWPGASEPTLRGIDVDVAAAETVAIVGASGSGKSTLARAILDLAPVTGGRMQLEGEDVGTSDRGARRRLQARRQIVWQDPAGSLDPRMRVGDQVAEPLLVHRAADRATARRRADELLARCGLPADAGDRRPRDFSGGQRQRIAIARAVILEPALLLCDEPTSALDGTARGGVVELLESLQRRLGMAMLLITHDFALVAHLADRVLVLDRGRVVEHGVTRDIIGSPSHPTARELLDAVPGRRHRPRPGTSDAPAVRPAATTAATNTTATPPAPAPAPSPHESPSDGSPACGPTST